MKFIESTNYKTIYNDMLKQFPQNELKNYVDFVSNFSNQYRLYNIYDNCFIGYLITYESKYFVFIDYIAILKEYQSLGYGSKILEFMKTFFRTKKGCLLEVEKPNSNDINTIRRINFYKKNGAKQININYLYPNKNGSLPMDLYFIPYNNTKENILEIKTFIKDLFNNVHKDIPHREEVFTQIFS